eukprot:240778-Chlamydomonas_euryale.AAC.1
MPAGAVVQAQHPQQQQQQQQPMRWSQLVLGTGVLALAGYAVHTIVTPYVAGFWRTWQASARESREAAAKAAADAEKAAAEMRDATRSLAAASEGVADMMRAVKDAQEWRCGGSCVEGEGRWGWRCGQVQHAGVVGGAGVDAWSRASAGSG